MKAPRDPQADRVLMVWAEAKIFSQALMAFIEYSVGLHVELLPRFEDFFQPHWGHNPDDVVRLLSGIVAEYPDLQDSDPYGTLVDAHDAFLDKAKEVGETP